jgi:DNA-binding CsgD family transcriptional regulator/pimeloyl-ACP methyl ester carboxylesterase
MRFVPSTGGARIGYWTAGRGTPLVYLGVPCISHAQFEPQLEPFSEWFRRLSEQHQLIRLDLRGYGASSREVQPETVDDLQADILAVADALRLKEFALFAQGGSVAAALALAARSSRVSHLVLCDGWAEGSKLRIHERIAAVESLAETDWRMYSQLIARLLMGSPDKDADAIAAFIRTCSTPISWKAYFRLFQATDVLDVLPAIPCQALIIHTGRNPLTGEGEASRLIASRIQRATLATFELVNFPLDGAAEVSSAINSFLPAADAVAERRTLPRLSPRELQVLELLALGRSNPEIAQALVIAPATASRHVHNLLNKLQVANRTEAAVLAARARGGAPDEPPPGG